MTPAGEHHARRGHAGQARESDEPPAHPDRSHRVIRGTNGTAQALEEAAATAATSDIWLFPDTSMADPTIPALTNSPANHVGTAVAIDNLPPPLWPADLGRSPAQYRRASATAGSFKQE